MEAPKVANGIPMVKVVKEEFCVPHLVELIVKKNDSITSRMKYQVSDVNGKVHFEVDGFQLTYRLKRRGKSMHDAAGFGLPLLILCEDKKHRHRWTVHRGGSSLGNEPLFSAQRSYTTEMRPRLEVFLPTSATEDIFDFQIVEYYSSKFYKVYKGPAVIAEVNYSSEFTGCCNLDERFKVKIYPGVDYAFIVALLVILREDCIVF